MWAIIQNQHKLVFISDTKEQAETKLNDLDIISSRMSIKTSDFLLVGLTRDRYDLVELKSGTIKLDTEQIKKALNTKRKNMKIEYLNQKHSTPN